jgi:hypothetical protein
MNSALDGVGGQLHAPAAFTPGKDPVSIVQEAVWAPGSVWTGAEKLAPTGIRSPDRPAGIASRYAGYAIPTPRISVGIKKKKGRDSKLKTVTNAG